MTATKPPDPGLGTRVRVLPRLDARIRTALEDIEAWFTQYPESYVAISGGKDSTTVLHLARRITFNL